MGKSTTKMRTICEICREVNDLHQSDSEIDKITREKLSEIAERAKRMVRKLEEYKEGTKKELFPEKTENRKEKRKLRRKEGYKKLQRIRGLDNEI